MKAAPTPHDAAAYGERIVAWAAQLDVPGLMLIFICVLLMVVLWRASRAQDFKFAQMLKDEQNKESALRFGVFIAIAVSSWVLMRAAINQATDREALTQLYWAYLFTWSGALVFVKAVEKWNGVLPWSKP